MWEKERKLVCFLYRASMPATSSTMAYWMGSNTCKIYKINTLAQIFIQYTFKKCLNPIPHRTLLDLEEELIEKVRRRREGGGAAEIGGGNREKGGGVLIGEGKKEEKRRAFLSCGGSRLTFSGMGVGGKTTNRAETWKPAPFFICTHNAISLGMR